MSKIDTLMWTECEQIKLYDQNEFISAIKKKYTITKWINNPHTIKMNVYNLFDFMFKCKVD